MTSKLARTGTLFALALCVATITILAAPPFAGASSAAPSRKTVSAVGISPAAPEPSEFRSLPVCQTPGAGHAGCLARSLAPRTDPAQRRMRPQGLARGTAVSAATSAFVCAQDYPACLTPTALQDAYFPGESPLAPTSEPQTIALVDAYDDPDIEADLGVYDSEFGLPACTEANSCFAKLNQRGESGHPPVAKTEAEKEEAEGWALEISTDVEAAHAVCQNCRVVLVEANSSAYADLLTAESTAAEAVHADEISNSWGGSEAELTASEIAVFEHPGVAITASAGDDGYLNWDEWETEPLQFDEPDFPASSSNVIAVGGTRLTLSGGSWQSERVWNDDQGGSREGAAGGGCSLRFSAPSWQRTVSDWPAVGCEDRRAVADVAADADPVSGVAVYDSVPYPYEESGRKKTAVLKWIPIGGTSLASPIVAAMFALAGGAHGVANPASTLYSHLGTNLLHDVVSGGNGECDATYTTCVGSMRPLSPFDCGEGVLICNAAPGYDGPTGVGTPAGVGAFTLTGESPDTGNPGGKGSGEGSKNTGGEGGKPVEEATGVEEKAAETEGSRTETSGASNQAPTPPNSGSPASPLATPSTPDVTVATHTLGSRLWSRVSQLTLTPHALAAIRRGPLPRSQIGFTFTLSAASAVRVVLSRETHAHGHVRWTVVPAEKFTLDNVRRGHNSAHLRSAEELAPGTYRITLAPAHGASRSRAFVVE